MAHVYILHSLKDEKLYIGCTRGSVAERLKKHNAGSVRSTKARRPLKLVYTLQLDSYKSARQKEMFFKSTTGRREIKKILNRNLGEMPE